MGGICLSLWLYGAKARNGCHMAEEEEKKKEEPCMNPVLSLLKTQRK